MANSNQPNPFKIFEQSYENLGLALLKEERFKTLLANDLSINAAILMFGGASYNVMSRRIGAHVDSEIYTPDTIRQINEEFRVLSNEVWMGHESLLKQLRGKTLANALNILTSPNSEFRIGTEDNIRMKSLFIIMIQSLIEGGHENKLIDGLLPAQEG